MIRFFIGIIILTLLFIYSDKVFDKIFKFFSPETQKATIFNSLKNNIGDLEDVLNEIEKNIDNPEFNKKIHLDNSLKIIEKSKNNLTELEKIEKSESSFTGKVIENLKDLKEGVENFFSSKKEKEESEISPPNQTSSELCPCPK